MFHSKKLKKAFDKTRIIKSEIETLMNEKQYVSAFVLKFLFLEQFLEILISLVFLKLNKEKATDLVELAREDVSGSTFGHKVMYLQKLNKQFKLGIEESLFRKLQKISSFRNKTVHRLLHSDTDIDILNRESKKWLTEIDVMHEELFSEYLAKN